MAKYPVSGSTATDLRTGTGGCIALMNDSTALTLADRKRVLWLRSFWGYQATSESYLALLDASHEASFAANKTRFLIHHGSENITNCSALPGIGLNSPIKVDFPPPGLKFVTQCTIFNNGGGTAATAGAWGGCGFEEG